MLRDNFAEFFVRKTLLVKPENLGGVLTGKYCGLPRSTLRSAFNTEPWIGRDEGSRHKNLIGHPLVNRKWFDVWNARERIIIARIADAEAVDKKEYYARRFFRSRHFL